MRSLGFYIRFMDEIDVVAAQRGQDLQSGCVRPEKHSGKTFIDRIERGFDFLVAEI
jgi:hypothetical protein